MREEPPIEPEKLLATLAEIFAARGAAREVAIVARATAEYEFVEEDYGISSYRLLVKIPVSLFVQIQHDQLDLERALLTEVDTVMVAQRGHRVAYINLCPLPNEDQMWREKAAAWLAGTGVTNQGRVRSDNIASRTCDGLLFRSQAEINLYRSLKQAGLTFAPLPVFVRGGENYRRMEPDFVVLDHGVVLVVEVDGDTVHQETPAEAHSRTAMLHQEGALVERVLASECETTAAATRTVRGLVERLRKARSLR